MTTRHILASALTVLLLAGCAGNADGPGASQASNDPIGSSAEPSSPVDPTLLPPSEEPTKPVIPDAKSHPQNLTGTVRAGVEPGCLVLQGDGGEYLLLLPDGGEHPEVVPGAQVTVVGQADPEMVTTCQQGTPFVVSEVRPG